MQELITQAGQILQQASDLMQHPAINGAVSGFVSWMGNVLGKSSAKEKLQMVEENRHDEADIASLTSNLEFMLEDNEGLQQQLAEKLNEINTIARKEGINITTTTNTINVTGDNNNTVQGANVQGNINITS